MRTRNRPTTARAGRPGQSRTLGQDRNRYEVPPDFDVPLPEEELQRFGL